jgi:hypothetical protein
MVENSLSEGIEWGQDGSLDFSAGRGLFSGNRSRILPHLRAKGKEDRIPTPSCLSG